MNQPQTTPIQTKIRLSRLGLTDIEVDRFYCTFRHEGLFYKVENYRTIETDTIEDIINKSFQI